MADQGTLLVVLDLCGIFVFAITGALVGGTQAARHLRGAGAGGCTGLGGGLLRDVLIGATPPAALADWRYLMVPVAAGLVTFVFHPAVGRFERVINIFDAAGLGLFGVTGALKALDYGLGPVPAALLGMVTGIGGGIARDLLAGRVPVVFSSELYATPALLAATWAVLADGWGCRWCWSRSPAWCSASAAGAGPAAQLARPPAQRVGQRLTRSAVEEVAQPLDLEVRDARGARSTTEAPRTRSR